MHSLREGLLELAQLKKLNKAALRRLKSSIRTIERELGPLDFLAVTGEQELAQIVRVPGSDDLWVVYGEYSDGTLDIIRQDGVFPQDTLIGWTPGESLRDYWKNVVRESRETEKPLPEEKSNVRPLFRTPSDRVKQKTKG